MTETIWQGFCCNTDVVGPQCHSYQHEVNSESFWDGLFSPRIYVCRLNRFGMSPQVGQKIQPEQQANGPAKFSIEITRDVINKNAEADALSLLPYIHQTGAIYWHNSIILRQVQNSNLTCSDNTDKHHANLKLTCEQFFYHGHSTEIINC